MNAKFKKKSVKCFRAPTVDGESEASPHIYVTIRYLKYPLEHKPLRK